MYWPGLQDDVLMASKYERLIGFVLGLKVNNYTSTLIELLLPHRYRRKKSPYSVV